MQDNRETPRPSARDQRNQARALVVASVALTAVLVGGSLGLWALVSHRHAPAPSDGADVPAVHDGDAPAEPEPQAQAAGAQQLPADDPRAAELALDPERQTEWSYHNNGEKVVYLTFDDGPSANTEKILDVLDQYGAKATFFVTGHEPDYRPAIRDAYLRGNTIGMHTFSHDYASVYASEQAYFDDLDQVSQVVKEQIGYVPYLVRFPGGASNTVSAKYSPGIMTALSQDVPARGYQYYDWNVSSSDAAGNSVPADTIVSSSCVEGYPNVMLLFHDSGAKTTTVEALPRIIEFYQERGYTFAPIDRSTFVVHHKVGN